MTTTYTHRTVRPAETYRGRTFEIVETTRETVKTSQWEIDQVHTYLEVKWAGMKTYGRGYAKAPAGTVEQVAKKLRAMIDVDLEDDAMRAELTAMISNDATNAEPLEAAPAVGDVVFVYAMGYYRRGRVIKLAKSRATVAYTTASSAGRVFRKAADFGALRAEITPAATPAPIAEQAAELAEARRTSTEQAPTYAAHVAEVAAAGGPVADAELADLADALRGGDRARLGGFVHAFDQPAAALCGVGPAGAERTAQGTTCPACTAVLEAPELELEAAARRRQLDAAVVEDMLTGDVEPYAAEAPARRDHYRAEAPVDIAGTLNSLARHGRVTPLNARRAFVQTPDGRLLVAEVVTTPGGRPTAPGRFRQLAIDPQVADEDGAQLDLFEAVAEATR